MIKQFNIKMMAMLLVFFVASCQKEKNNDNEGTYIESGSAIVVNEGAFGSNNGSISFISAEGVVKNNIFELANNGSPLGDVVQSFARVGNKGLICVNNSQKIEVVDVKTFQRLATINAGDTTNYPRYAVAVASNKAFITNGSGDGIVAVLNLDNYSITKTIPVGDGPEQMEIASGNVYVCNSGGWGVDSTVSVINIGSETVTKTIKVGDIPTKIIRDAQENLWVLCNGQTDFSAWPIVKNLTPAKLVRINTSTQSVDRVFTLIEANGNTQKLNIAIGNNGTSVYYAIDNDIYKLGIDVTALPSSKLFTTSGIYGLGTSYNQQIWVLQAPSFSSSGKVIKYSNAGTAIDSVSVGIGPNGVVFNP